VYLEFFLERIGAETLSKRVVEQLLISDSDLKNWLNLPNSHSIKKQDLGS